jgi:hypothetical protein
VKTVLHFSEEKESNGGIRWVGNVARIGEKRNAYKILVGKLEGNKSLWRSRYGWEDNLKECEGLGKGEEFCASKVKLIFQVMYISYNVLKFTVTILHFFPYHN